MAKRKKSRGHYCWCCDRVMANERFSGRGHARHICKDCSKRFLSHPDERVRRYAEAVAAGPRGRGTDDPAVL